MSLSITLQSALSGLLAAQRGLDLVSQNVANVNTDGYTRKIGKADTLAVAGDSIGVNIGPAQREVNEALFRTLLSEKGLLARLQTDDAMYNHMQQLFGLPGDETTLGHSITKFNEALETLATQPSKPGSQTMAVQAAIDLADHLGQVSDDLQKLRVEADRAISDAVAEINTQLEIVQDLNATIAHNLATQRETADLEDKRDQALTKLAELIDISYYRQNDGSVVIYTGGGRVLLDRQAKELSHTAVGNLYSGMTYAAGNFDGIRVGDVDITGEIRSGKLKSLIDMRDKAMPDLQAEIDTLAARVKEEVNQVHNRTTSYPQLAQTLEGTRGFVDSSAQGIGLAGDDDVAVVLYDANGDEVASTTLRTAMGWAANGDTPLGTIDDVAAALDGFLSGHGGSASVVNGKLTIDAGANGIAFRDLPGGSAPAAGEAPADIAIRFDADGNGAFDGYESSVAGFSNFFGLNDLFVDARSQDTWDSEIKSAGWSAAAGTFTLTDSAGNTDTVTLTGGESLADIAEQINQLAGIDVKAAVVPEGPGYRLRITQSQNAEMMITGTPLADLGMAPSVNGTATNLAVRGDIVADPGRLGTGALQHDGTAYFLSEGDNTGVLGMSEALTSKHDFTNAGRVTRGKYALSEFASSVVSLNSGAASAVADKLSYQQSLTADLTYQRESESGVNLDEEMNAMLVYQQAYAASARIISTTQRMFEILENIR